MCVFGLVLVFCLWLFIFFCPQIQSTSGSLNMICLVGFVILLQFSLTARIAAVLFLQKRKTGGFFALLTTMFMYIGTSQTTNTNISISLLFNVVGDFCLKSIARIRLQTVVHVCPTVSFI